MADDLQALLLERIQFAKPEHVIECIHAHGADPNIPDAAGSYPLHYAVHHNRPDMVRALLEHGAMPTIDARNGNHRSPLALASRQGYAEVLDILLRAGADPHAKDVGEMDALGEAVWSREFQLLISLLRYGADPNALQAGNTPLQLAAKYTAVYCFRWLLAAGADPAATIESGQTVREMVQDNLGIKEQQILRHLEQHERLPVLDEATIPHLAKAQLVKENEHGFTLLDNPRTWVHFDAIASTLEMRGEKIEVDDVLEERPEDRPTYLQVAVQAFKLEALQRHFASQHDVLMANDLDVPTKFTKHPLVELIDQTGQLNALFLGDLWAHQPLGAMQELHQSLPPEMQEKIGLHQAQAKARMHRETKQQGRA